MNEETRTSVERGLKQARKGEFSQNPPDLEADEKLIKEIEANEKEDPFRLNDLFDAFFTMASKEAKPTKVVIGLCGELSGGYVSENGALVESCSMVRNEDAKGEILKHLATHGGCDTVLLHGMLFTDKDGKLKLIASEDEGEIGSLRDEVGQGKNSSNEEGTSGER